MCAALFSKKTIDSQVYCRKKMLTPTGAQSKIMDAFRLSDEFRQSYGSYLIEENPNRESIQLAKRVIAKRLQIDSVDLNEYYDLIADLLYTRYVLGYYNPEYFSFGFKDKTNEQRLEFLPDMQRNVYFRALNDQKEFNNILDNKFKTFHLLKSYYNRDVIYVTGEKDYPAFREFTKAHTTFIVKPDISYGGKGIVWATCDKPSDSRTVFDSLRENNGRFLCEEAIYPAEYMKQLYSGSVNTVRIVTYYNGIDEPVPFLPMLRVGWGGSIVDNYTSGGIIAEIDTATGVICSDGLTKSGVRFDKHPDTGVVFKGFQIRDWDTLVDMAKNMAKLIPQVRVVGWDITASAEKGWQVIEANAHPDITIRQGCRQIGIRRRFEEIVEWKKYSSK